jgi:hypothetical protein
MFLYTRREKAKHGYMFLYTCNEKEKNMFLYTRNDVNDVNDD